MSGDPLHGRERIIHRGGEPSLGRMTVVDRDDDGVGPNTEIATEGFVRIGAAEHPTATMEVHDDRMWSAARRTIQSIRPLTGRTRQHAVTDGANGRPWRPG